MSGEREALLAAIGHALETGTTTRVDNSNFVIATDLTLLEITANGGEREALGIAKASPKRQEGDGRTVYLFEFGAFPYMEAER